MCRRNGVKDKLDERELKIYIYAHYIDDVDDIGLGVIMMMVVVVVMLMLVVVVMMLMVVMLMMVMSAQIVLAAINYCLCCLSVTCLYFAFCASLMSINCELGVKNKNKKKLMEEKTSLYVTRLMKIL